MENNTFTIKDLSNLSNTLESFTTKTIKKLSEAVEYTKEDLDLLNACMYTLNNIGALIYQSMQMPEQGEEEVKDGANN